MTIVAVNGGGNTPQVVNDGDVDGRDFLVWQRGGSPLETGAFEIKDFSFGVENPTTIGGDTFDFQPQLTSEPTAPAMGDFDNNGDVDGRDFLAWQRQSDTSETDEGPDLLLGADGIDTFNFQPQLTSELTAPEPYMSGNDLRLWQSNYGHTFEMSDPNADLLATPGPDVHDSSTNPSNDGFADGHNDGGLIINWTPAADGLLLPY